MNKEERLKVLLENAINLLQSYICDDAEDYYIDEEYVSPEEMLFRTLQNEIGMTVEEIEEYTDLDTDFDEDFEEDFDEDY